MTKVKQDEQDKELPLEALILQCKKERYKMGYASLRWAKEIKQKENLPEPIPLLIPRALREILTQKVSLKEIEKLPMVVRAAPAPPPPPPAPTAPSTPTIKFKVQPEEDKVEPVKEAKAKAKEEPKESKESKEETK